MKLVDLIQALTEIVADVGDCDVYITTDNETQMYDTVLLHYVPENKFLSKPILRLEGTVDDGEEE